MQHDFKEIQKKIAEEWQRAGIYKFGQRKKGEVFSIDTPPPTISGEIHMGHVYGYVQQDFIARFKRMLGFRVFYPFGFDDNGIATERFVEQERGIKANKMSREDFIKICLETTRRVEDKMKNLWIELGISADWDLLYRTISPEVIKISQLSFLKLYEDGRIYRKKGPTFFCPECSTAVSQFELEDMEKESEFIDLAFKAGEQEVIISTTRPELLASCVAVFYNPKDERYKHLKGLRAEVPLYKHNVPILQDHRVEMEKGTGLVMCCTFGDQTDIEWYLAHNLPLRIAINEKGEMTELARDLKGLKVIDARKEIIKKLEEIGALRGRRKIKHYVKVHERCSTAIEFMVTEQWFIKQLDLKEKLLRAGREMKWFPGHMIARYENWVKALEWDWCISRQRYFGIPFPVWYCKKCNEIILAKEEDLPVNPLWDKPSRKCKCRSQDLRPEKDVLDTWATSSLTPLINAKWDGTKYNEEIYPMNLRPQGHDIISFWLFHTVLKCLLHTEKVPFKEIYINGWVLDEKGKKMSKSKGNIISPLKIMEEHSADAIRYWSAGTKFGEDISFNKKEILEGERFVKKLVSVSNFAEQFLNKESKSGIAHEGLEEIDLWMLSKINSMIEECSKYYNKYEFFNARREIRNIFWHCFCDNYIEIVKKRLYSKDKNAIKVLYKAFLVSLKVLAPIMPFITEFIYQKLYRKFELAKSIHELKFPKKEILNYEAEKFGDVAISIISALRKFKSSKNMPLNSEIEKAVIYCDPKIEKFAKAIKDAMNIKNLEIKPIEKIEEKIKEVKLNYAVLGKKYKKLVKKFENSIKKGKFKFRNGNLILDTDAGNFELKPGEFEVKKEFGYIGKKGESIEGEAFLIIL